jgi:CRP/FNR family transcriptional regulator, cyclic AMP receptor protein
MIQEEELADIALFSGLTAEERRAIAKISREQNYRKGAVIITEGEKTAALFVVIEGKAVVVGIDDEGRQIVLNEFGSGEHFGEMSFIDGAPRCADVEVGAASRLLVVPRDQFRNIVADNPEICFNLMKGLNEKLRNATEQIKDLAFRDVYGRVARFLDKSARTEGEVRVIDERLTHQDIAFRVGSSREMISRIFKELRFGGFVEMRDRKIVLLKELPFRW